MGKNLTYEEVKYYIEVQSNTGCKLLSTEYINAKSKLLIQCSCGNTFYVAYHHFREGKTISCKECGLKRIKESNLLSYDYIKDFIEIESNSGCKLLSTEYNGIHDLLKVQCLCGEIFYVKFATFKYDNKHQCDKCSNKIKWDYKMVKEYVELRGYELISDKYKDNKTKLILKDKDGYYYHINFDNLHKGNTPYIAEPNNIYSIQNINLWLIKNNKDFRLVDGQKYNNLKTKLKWQCLKEDCGDIFEMTWNCVQRGQGCAVCAGQQVGLSNCLASKKPNIVSEWHPTKNGNLTPYDFTYGSNKEVWWQCSECGREWQARINCRNVCGCPECNKSKGEKECKKYFIFNNIYFIPQKEFDNLIGLGGRNLSYDFYLPQYNLLIEYQGEFHDGTAIQQSKENLNKQLEHDRRKKEYAHNNNINLLEIWYWDFDNIEEILIRELMINNEQIIH